MDNHDHYFKSLLLEYPQYPLRVEDTKFCYILRLLYPNPTKIFKSEARVSDQIIENVQYISKKTKQKLKKRTKPYGQPIARTATEISEVFVKYQSALKNWL